MKVTHILQTYGTYEHSVPHEEGSQLLYRTFFLKFDLLLFKLDVSVNITSGGWTGRRTEGRVLEWHLNPWIIKCKLAQNKNKHLFHRQY